jgi:iron complex transport system ATP-binding protein
MDEPTASLDFGNQTLVLSHVRALARRGIAVVLSTHDPDHAFFCADRAALLKDGRLLHLGRPAEVITAASLRELYDVEVEVLEHAAYEGAERRRVCVPLRPVRN